MKPSQNFHRWVSIKEHFNTYFVCSLMATTSTFVHNNLASKTNFNSFVVCKQFITLLNVTFWIYHLKINAYNKSCSRISRTADSRAEKDVVFVQFKCVLGLYKQKVEFLENVFKELIISDCICVYVSFANRWLHCKVHSMVTK